MPRRSGDSVEIAAVLLGDQIEAVRLNTRRSHFLSERDLDGFDWNHVRKLHRSSSRVAPNRDEQRDHREFRRPTITVSSPFRHRGQYVPATVHKRGVHPGAPTPYMRNCARSLSEPTVAPSTR